MFVSFPLHAYSPRRSFSFVGPKTFFRISNSIAPGSLALQVKLWSSIFRHVKSHTHLNIVPEKHCHPCEFHCLATLGLTPSCLQIRPSSRGRQLLCQHDVLVCNNIIIFTSVSLPSPVFPDFFSLRIWTQIFHTGNSDMDQAIAKKVYVLFQCGIFSNVGNISKPFLGQACQNLLKQLHFVIFYTVLNKVARYTFL